MAGDVKDGVEYRERIAALNDQLRHTFWGGKVMTTLAVNALPDNRRAELFLAVSAYDDFTPDNDPHGERDFGSITMAGKKFFWKISYYDARMEFGSEDPANPDVTTRVLTIMRADEY
jgi:hypothetical protein